MGILFKGGNYCHEDQAFLPRILRIEKQKSCIKGLPLLGSAACSLFAIQEVCKMSVPTGLFSCHAIRLKPGQDLVKELVKFVSAISCSSAFVLTCVGSLSDANLRMADACRDNKEKFLRLEQPTEIVSLVGTISKNGKTHLHISLSDKEGKVIGGHLPSGGGAIVRTTAEIVVGTSNSVTFTREFDEESGFDELVVS